MADLPSPSGVHPTNKLLAATMGEHIPFSRPNTPGSPGGSKPTLGFIGLGVMGYWMARNLAQHAAEHGHPPLHVFNRTRSKCDALHKELGGNKVIVADSAADLALDCDVVCTMLGSDEAVKSVFLQFQEVLKTSKHTKTKIFVEMSTIYPSLAGELDEMLSPHEHTRLITCPVFGPPAAADKAQLLLIMSGDYRSKKEVAYLLVPSVGRKIIDLGGNLEKAPTFKLIGNSLIIGSLEVMSEMATISEKSGIGAEAAFELLKEITPAPALVGYMQKIVRDEFDGTKGFSIDGGIKDASHIRRLTALYNAPMPVIDVAHQHFLTARAAHLAQQAKGESEFEVIDWSSLVAGSRLAAGMDAFQGSTLAKVVREDD